MSADARFAVVTEADKFGRVPLGLLFADGVTADECRLYAVLTTYDYRQDHECWPTQDELAKRIGVSSRTVRRVLTLLEDRGAIEQRRQRRKANLIILRADVVDRPILSSQESLSGQNPLLDRTDPAFVPLTNETYNESGARKRATRLPIPFDVTDAMVEWCDRELPGLDWERETSKFVDHFKAASGRNATKMDWPAAWRNWMRKSTEGWR